jgi:hypothetical protein
VNNFGLDSNDLSDFFSTISEGKKIKKEELNDLVGESFDDFFWSKLKEEVEPKKTKKIIRKIKKEDKEVPKTLIESNFIEPPTVKTKDPLTPLNQKFVTLDELNRHYNLFLSRIQQQLSTLGGGGETNLTYMDVPITSVTTSSYTIRPQDYYIGVNYAGAVTITLPKADREGKIFVVKDELGESSKGTNRHITVLPSGNDLIDNRDRAILAYDYGSLTFIWKSNSWRVI